MATNEDIENELDHETFGDVQSTSRSVDDALHCNICNNKLTNPRLLSCLHVFCEACLDKTVTEGNADSKNKSFIIKCSECEQETKIGCQNASSLPLDFVSCNMLDMLAVETMSVLCTSCKSSEKAVSRCADCGNFLCPNCNNAHEVMRCFENHHVYSLEELKSSPKFIPKPVVCSLHPSEQIKFYCYSCQVVTCSECIGEHKLAEHSHGRIKDAEPKLREELTTLIKESKSRVMFCDEASNTLGNALHELETQRENAKGLIMESFQSYKAILEARRDELLQELNTLHSQHELEIMDLCHLVQKNGTLMEHACRFSTRLLEHGTPHEILTLRKVVGEQLMNLINNTPTPEVAVKLEFETDIEKFTGAIRDAFGKFKTQEIARNGKDTLLQLDHINAMQYASSSTGLNLSSVSTMSNGSSPISLPSSSMQSSFEGDLAAASSYNLPPPVTNPQVLPGHMASLRRIQEHNLAQLARLAEKIELDEVPTSGHPSPTQSRFNFADLFTGDISSTNNALNNLQALAKLTLNAQEATNGGINGNPVLNCATPHLLDQATPTTLSLNGDGYHSLSNPTSPILPAAGLNGFHGPPPPLGSAFPTRSKVSTMQIRCKFGQLGPSKSQFNSPHGFCLGLDEDIIVADTNNHRIEVFEKNGTFKFQFGIPGKEEGQLWYPRKVAVMRPSGKFVVCDRGNERSRMQIFSKNGHFVKKIAIRYIDIVAGLAVTSEGLIVAVDSVSPTVFVISESGELVRWFDCSDFMREPSDIAINGEFDLRQAIALNYAIRLSASYSR